MQINLNGMSFATVVPMFEWLSKTLGPGNINGCRPEANWAIVDKIITIHDSHHAFMFILSVYNTSPPVIQDT